MTSTVHIFRTEDETQAFARQLATLKPARVIALSGDLGAGKTTFVRAFIRSLQNGNNVRVKSPSYALHHHYNTTPQSHHLDLYRLTSPHQIEELGLLEIIHEQNGFVLIEWPEIIGPQLPQDTIHILFEDIEDGVRRVTVSSI